jgi:2-iminobutanoate/2-iminopropanoate deaminase
MSRTAITSNGAAAVGPYSHAIESQGIIYLSGQTPLDPATGKLANGNIAAQTKQCFQNLFSVLEAAGLGHDAVVEVRVYLTDMNDFTAMNEVYATQFKAPYPARTTIGCASLPLGARIEIGMIATRG